MNAQLTRIAAQQRIADLRRSADSAAGATAAPSAPARDRNPLRRLMLSPLSVEHEAGLAALLEDLGPESRYRRFLSPKPRFTARELAYLTRVDGARHIAVGAIDPATDAIVGAGHCVRYPDRRGDAEMALEVADQMQGRGIGTALALRLVEHAAANGVTVLLATTLRENRPSRALLRRCGFRVRGGDGAVIEAELCVA